MLSRTIPFDDLRMTDTDRLGNRCSKCWYWTPEQASWRPPKKSVRLVKVTKRCVGQGGGPGQKRAVGPQGMGRRAQSSRSRGSSECRHRASRVIVDKEVG